MITIWLIVCLELNSWHQASENQSSRSPIPAKLHDNHRWAWHPNRDPTVWQQKWGDKVHFKGLALADFQLHICKYENCDFCKFKNNLNITDHIRSNMLWQLGDPWNALMLFNWYWSWFPSSDNCHGNSQQAPSMAKQFSVEISSQSILRRKQE